MTKLIKIQVRDYPKTSKYTLKEMVVNPGLYITPGMDNAFFYISEGGEDLFIDVDQSSIEVLDEESWTKHEFVKVNSKIIITLGGE